ncbi:MAG TPA: hypothetical protein VE861_03805 [Gemmatimonadaceae bacterium]|nr:hypothetical protein [Gemmatimonadaceae bacterium]
MTTASLSSRRAGLRACALGLLLAGSNVAMAQTAAPPRGWTVVPDAGGDRAQVKAAEMKPGFHVTTGPAAILFDSGMRARGDWRLEATVHLFDPGARAEGFGVFFGGRALTGAAPTYAYALVRRDGKALLKVREGRTTRTVRDWAANGAIPQWKPGVPGASVKYPLVVEAKGDRVTMSVGGTQVLDAARSELLTDGIVGLRVNHSLNLHIEKVSVTLLSPR